jgi:hypothetical protein
MKKKFYSIITILLVGMAFSFSSCLKDSKNYVNVSQGAALAELPLEAYNGVGVPVSEAYATTTTTAVIQLAVNIASANTLGTATTFKLGLDTAAITAYNTANSTSYTLLPAADYSVPSWSVTVPAGQHLAYLNITVKVSSIDPSGQYLLPIKILSAGGLTIDQYNELLYAVQVKNVFDGTYTVTGTMVDKTNAALTAYYPATVQLQTTGANSNIYYDVSQPTSGGNGHLILSSGAINEYGDFDPVFTFDQTTQKVTGVVNAYGQPAADGRSAILDPTGVNAYTGTPGQKGFVIQVSYIMVQSGVNRTYFNETYTYTGSR